MSYYYLVASLPGLSLDTPPPFTTEGFLQSCEGPLAPSLLNDLRLALDGRAAEGASPACRQWAGFETQLRNAVARLRASQRGVDPKPYLRSHEGFEGYIEKAVTEAFARPNPLEREQALDRCRWYLLEQLAVQDAFGFAAVLAFALSLQMVERWQRFKDEAGRIRFDEIIDANLKREGLSIEFEVQVEP